MRTTVNRDHLRMEISGLNASQVAKGEPDDDGDDDDDDNDGDYEIVKMEDIAS